MILPLQSPLDFQVLLTRFEAKVYKTETCWIWTAATDSSGYGSFNVQGRSLGAHKVSYLIYKGDIAEKLQVRHTCDNPKCVNPNHLLLGSHSDNMQDRSQRGRWKGKQKLTQQDYNEIINLRIQGQTLAQIAKKFNISDVHVLHVTRRIK